MGGELGPGGVQTVELRPSLPVPTSEPFSVQRLSNPWGRPPVVRHPVLERVRVEDGGRGLSTRGNRVGAKVGGPLEYGSDDVGVDLRGRGPFRDSDHEEHTPNCPVRVTGETLGRVGPFHYVYVGGLPV